MENSSTNSPVNLLTDFMSFVREEHLDELAKKYISLVKKLRIPLMQYFTHISDDELFNLSSIGLEKFLRDFEEGKAYEVAERSLILWENDELPGISRDKVEPSDLVFISLSQKKSLFSLIPKFTSDILIAFKIVEELEEYYMLTQDAAFNLYDKLKTNAVKEATNLKAKNDSIQESLYKEKEISLLKSSFISTVSHEFRTPLATIQAINSIIKNYSNKMLEEEKIAQHSIIEEQINNLAKMLDDFVIIGKIESGELELNCEDINIETLLNQIIRELEISNYDTKRIKPSYNCSDFFYGDKRLIRQITSNLLTNALKYSSKEIIFNIISSSEKLLITVKDSGIGIPIKEKKKVFEQFYRASNINTVAGTGLGLSIIKKSILRCNGTIDFTSNINQGTEFIVTIPSQENIRND